MTSNLGCIGLDVDGGDELDRLIAAVLPKAESLGHADDLHVLRWQDPSGARLVVGVRDGDVVDLLPSFAATPGVRFANLKPASDDVATARVVDADGEQLTSMVVELEQRRLVRTVDAPFDVPVTLVALGSAITTHEDAEAFARSDASLLNSTGSERGERPAYYEPEWVWPPRVAADSFIAYGVFGKPEDAEAYAQLAGTVLRAERRTVEQTGQQFIVVRIRTTGFEVDVCLAASDHPVLPTPGQIIAGEVFLVASLGHLPPARATRKKFGWRRD